MAVRPSPVRTPKPARHAGMGAIPYRSGTTFRVWAPNASNVFVVGDFNDWAATATPLAAEDGGFWSADVSRVRPGAAYRFRIVAGETIIERRDPYGRALNADTSATIVTRQMMPREIPRYQTPVWNEMVIYEMHIGTFNAREGKLPGTFDDAIARFSYLRDLGVNVIEVLPIMEFPGDISWGYNPSQPFAVESAYGGPEAFLRFIASAHAHGLAVIVDVVYNHFGPDDLDLWRFDGWFEHEGGGIYFYNDDRAKTPWGDTRPDYGRGAVRQYLRDNALMWLQDYDADGLRFDAVGYIRNVNGVDGEDGALGDGWSLLHWINSEIRATQPWKITIAEDLNSNEAITSHDDGGAGFDAQWDPQFVYPVRAVLAALADEDRDLNNIINAISHRHNDDAFRRVVYTESHDDVANGKVRLPEEIAPGDANTWFAKKRSTLGAALIFTVPGIPMLFQGQEFLADASFDDNVPLDWQVAATHSGITRLYHDLMALRRNADNVTRGLAGQSTEVIHVNHDEKVLAFHRWDAGGPGDSVVVVMNFADHRQEEYRIGLPAPGEWRVRFNSDSNVYDADFGNFATVDRMAEDNPQDGLPHSVVLGIGPYSAVILSQEPTL